VLLTILGFDAKNSQDPLAFLDMRGFDDNDKDDLFNFLSNIDLNDVDVDDPSTYINIVGQDPYFWIILFNMDEDEEEAFLERLNEENGDDKTEDNGNGNGDDKTTGNGNDNGETDGNDNGDDEEIDEDMKHLLTDFTHLIKGSQDPLAVLEMFDLKPDEQQALLDFLTDLDLENMTDEEWEELLKWYTLVKDDYQNLLDSIESNKNDTVEKDDHITIEEDEDTTVLTT